MRNLNRYFYCLMFVLILLTANQIHAQRDYQFIGMDPQNPINWFSNNNWNCSPSPCTFPGADDTARIGTLLPMGGYIIYTPRAVGTAQVKDLNILNGSSLTFTTFTTTGIFNLADLPSSSARIEAFVNGSVFNNNGTMNILTQSGTSTFAGVFNFNNFGTVNSSNLFVTNGATIINHPNASFFIHATNGFGIGGGHTFNNLGTLSKPSSPGLAVISLVNLINSGSVEVGSGTLQIGGAGSSITSNCGSFRTLNASAVLLLLANITANPCPSPLNPPGDTATNFYGAGRIPIQANLILNSGDVGFGFRHPTSGAVTIGNVEFAGDSITGGGNIRVIADLNNLTVFNWQTGNIGGTGSLDVEPFGTLNITPPFGGVQLNRNVNNSGTTILTGGLGNTSAPYTFNNLPGSVFEIRNNGTLNGLADSVINNGGTIRKTGSGTARINVKLNSTGPIESLEETLEINAPDTVIDVQNNQIIAVVGATFRAGNLRWRLTAGVRFEGDGEKQFSSGSTTTIVDTDVPVRNFVLDGGTIIGEGISPRLSLTGSLSRFNNNSRITNTRVTNQNSLLLQSNVFFNTVTLENQGTINAANNASLRQQTGGAFSFTNFGSLFPGLASTPGALFMDGNFTQTQSGNLTVDIGGITPGTQHDQFRIFAGAAGGTGNAMLSGTLNVNFVNGFVPAPNQFFQIMTCQTSCNGQFQQINGVNLPGGNILIPGYGPNAVSLITTAVNGSINAPVLTVAKSFAGDTLIRGAYSAAPNTSYLISFYQGCSGNAVNIGTKVVTTNSSGVAELFFFTTRSIPVGEFVSARATDASNQTSNLSNCLQVVKSPNFADFDGDLKTDLSIFRPNNNFSEFVPGLSEWWIQRSSDNVTIAYQFGTPTDKITPGDYDGDGKTDLAFWRPSTGEWFVLRSSNLTFFSAPFGVSTDKPAPADFDGDGKTDLAVFRPSQTTWFINKSSGGVDIIPFGLSNDIPQPADYDGDGKADVAIFRPTGGSGQSEWWILRSTAGLFATPFGTATDKPVPGDYTGDGKADIAFWRPSSGEWFVLRSEDLSFYSAPFGAMGDIPVAGDYDGDGKTDLAVFRPTNVTWFVLKSSGGTLIQQFGLTGDIPVPSAFVP